jgi:hypothetical protein
MNGRSGRHYYSRNWYSIDWDNDWPLYGDNFDSLLLNTVRVNIVRSKDSSYHIQRLKFSHGKTQLQAQELARKINFDIIQQDSILLLSRGFVISKEDKFRNQQLLVVIEVPVGKKIEMDKSIDEFHWFTINISRRRGWNIRDYDESYDNYNNMADSYGWSSNVEYIMTKDGLERTDKKAEDRNDDNDDQKISPKSGGTYRYKNHTDSMREKGKKDRKEPATEKKAKDTTQPGSEKKLAATTTSEQISSPIYLLSTLFQ